MAVNYTPSLSSGLGPSPVKKSDMQGWLNEISNGIASLDPRATPIYASRASAVSAAPGLPASLTHIMVREGTALVIRSRTASADDPLFTSGAQWGVVMRQDGAALLGQVAVSLDGVAGTPQAITATVPAALLSLGQGDITDGQEITLTPIATNTDANPTLRVDRGAIQGAVRGIRSADGGVWPAGGFVVGRAYTLRRTGTLYRVVRGAVTPTELVAEAAARELGDQHSKDRANHTGTQSMDSVLGLEDAISDRVDYAELGKTVPVISGEEVRIDGTLGAEVRFQPGSALARALRHSDVSLLESGRLAFSWPAFSALRRPADYRLRADEDGFQGVVIEPAGVSWSPPDNLLTGTNVLTALTIADLGSTSPVEGQTWRRLSAVAGGSSIRQMGNPAFAAQAGKIYQADLVVRSAGAPNAVLRFGSYILNSGKDTYVNIDLSTGAINRSTAPELVGIELTRLSGGAWHLSARIAADRATGAAQVFVVPQSSGSLDHRNSVFDANQSLLDVAALCVCESPAPRQVSFNSGMGTPLAPQVVEMPGAADASDGVLHVRFRPARSLRPTGFVPVASWEGAAAGIALELSQTEIRARFHQGGQNFTLSAAAEFAHTFDVAVSRAGSVLSLSVNGDLVTRADLPASGVPERRTLRLGLSSGNNRPFAGIVALARASSLPIAGHSLRGVTEPELSPGRGLLTPVVMGINGRPIVSADGDGRIDFTPTERTQSEILSGGIIGRGLPEDATGLTPKEDGSLYYLTSKFGRPLHVRRNAEGLNKVAGPDNVYEIHIAMGQSLALANTYAQPLDWEAVPLFFDVNDGMAQTITTTNASGAVEATRLSEPYSYTPAAVPGAGSISYPILHALSRLRIIYDAATPRKIVGKTFAIGGASISELMPHLLYQDYPYITDAETGEVTWKNDAQLATGASPTFWRAVRQWMASVKSVLDSEGATGVPGVFYWVHGTNNRTGSGYTEALEAARIDVHNLYKEFFGPDVPEPLWVMTQVGSRSYNNTAPWLVQYNQVEFAEAHADSRVVLGGPWYNPDIRLVAFEEDGTFGHTHPDYASSSLMGEILATAAYEVQNGRKWTIGRPEVTFSADRRFVTLDYSMWLRPDERLIIAPDTYYQGVGIDAGKGVEVYRTDGSKLATVGLTTDGQRYVLELQAPAPTGQTLRVSYADQKADHNGSPNYAFRGLCRTSWERPSMRQSGKFVRRWMPVFKREVTL